MSILFQEAAEDGRRLTTTAEVVRVETGRVVLALSDGRTVSFDLQAILNEVTPSRRPRRVVNS